jgi:hypothetical protein
MTEGKVTAKNLYYWLTVLGTKEELAIKRAIKELLYE